MIEPKVGDLVMVAVEKQDVQWVAGMNEWVASTQASMPEPAEQVIGVVAFNQPDALFVAQGMKPTGESFVFRGVVRIPRSTIVDIAQLRRYTKTAIASGRLDPESVSLGAQPQFGGADMRKPRKVDEHEPEPVANVEQAVPKEDIPPSMRDGKGN